MARSRDDSRTMTTVLLRLGYACAPRRRADVVAALRVIDGIGAPVGWPSGRYLHVDTRAAGEPDLEVEYTFTSLADLEVREARLREQVRASARDGGPDTTSWQAHLIGPGARRFLTVVDDPVGRPAGNAGTASGGRPAPPSPSVPLASRPASDDPAPLPEAPPPAPAVDGPEDDVEDDVEDDEGPEVAPDDEPIDLDPSSLRPETEVPPPLPPGERQARVASLLREVPGVRIGFGTTTPPPRPGRSNRPPD